MENFRHITIDRRRLRAEVVAHNLLHALEPWLDRFERLEKWAERQREEDERRGVPRVRRDIYEKLFEVLYAAGIEVITDADRAAAGLEWRNHLGSTETELRIMEDRLTAAMLSPMPPVCFPPKEQA